MSELVRLRPLELVGERPFTHPQNNLEDLVVLSEMLARLRQVLATPEGLPAGERPVILLLFEPDGRSHRIAISKPDELLMASEFTVIGFFGRKWPVADLTILDGVDVELIHHFPLHPGVLSYSTLELGDGSFGNLVMLAGPEAIEHWRTNPKHNYATAELAPKYYANVRLHHYFLPNGLMAAQTPIHLRTKYYDYSGDRPWLAVRETDSSCPSNPPTEFPPLASPSSPKSPNSRSFIMP